MLLPTSDNPVPITKDTEELVLDALPKTKWEHAKKIMSHLAKNDIKVTPEGRIYYDSINQSGSYLWFLLQYLLKTIKPT